MTYEPKYSPDLKDVIERPQSKFAVGVFVFLLLFVLLLVLLGIVVKSPDSIVADVRVSSNNPPIVLKPQSSGRIRFIKESLPGDADCGEYLAYIDNPAHYEDIQKERQLQQAIVHIKNQYGKDAVLKAMNILDKATARKRHQLIGGHNAQ